MSRRIAIVEDEPAIRENYADALRRQGYEVATHATRDAALASFRTRLPDLAVVDLGLGDDPDAGYTLCRELRALSPTVPILILSARDSDVDIVSGLRVGADDYLTKPFSPRELLARIRALLRRAKAQATVADQLAKIRAYRFGTWELNVGLRKLKDSEGQKVDLTNGEFSLLTAFLSAPQRILTRDQLLELSRLHNAEVYDRSIDLQILRLRRKIDADPAHPQVITTERGVGYLFDAVVEVVR